MNKITTVGVDLAKEVIVVCAGDAAGRAMYFHQFSFHGFAQWAANLPPCTFGMEACSSAHHWASTAHGARAYAPLDGGGVRRSVSQEPRRQERPQRCPGDLERRARTRHALCHREIPRAANDARVASHALGVIQERTALINRMRGLLAEFGFWLGRSPAVLIRSLPELAHTSSIPERLRPLLAQGYEQLQILKQRIEECERTIHAHAENSVTAQRIAHSQASARSPPAP